MLAAAKTRVILAARSAFFGRLGLCPIPRTRRDAVGGVEQANPTHCPECERSPRESRGFRGISSPASGLRYSTLPFTPSSRALSMTVCLKAVITRVATAVDTWETVRTFARHDRQLQGVPGAIAVLHTNTRDLRFHPHVHLVMPAAAVDAQRRQWRSKRNP